MMDKQTSDERLLKLIEGTGEPKRKQIITPGQRNPLINHLPANLNLVELKSKLKRLKINLFSLNKGLIGLAVLLTLVFLYTLLGVSALPKSSAAFFNPTDASAIVKLISSVQAQGLIRKNIFNQNIKRDFFLPSGSKSSINTEQPGSDLSEELKDLKLVGIIWSKNPEVMIENAKDSRTYTLKKGESLNEQFKVKEVSRNSAILEVITEAGPKEYEIR